MAPPMCIEFSAGLTCTNTDDAVWVDQEGFLRCFNTVGFPSAGAIDVTGHVEQRASIAATDKPQDYADDASPEKDETGKAGVHVARGSTLDTRDGEVPLEKAHCNYLTLSDDYKLSGGCAPSESQGWQCSDLWLNEYGIPLSKYILSALEPD
jgi:hypothetical protein